MYFRFPIAGLAALICLATSLAGPVQAQQPKSIFLTVEGDPVAIHLYRPGGPGPFPLLVLSHGSPRSAADRAGYGPGTMRDQASALAQRGLAVAVVIRRGYGGTGRWAETYGGCAQPDYYRAGLASAQDIEAATEVLSREPGIDASRIVLMGVSAGGWASVAAGSRRHVLGVVSFAGGRGSRGPDDVCDESALISAIGRYGATSRSPEMWIYSVNDRFFGPALARRMFGAFTAGGGKATFVEAPAYRNDGHAYFNNISAWMPQVTGFFRTIGFTP